jgi:hypothetical protein
MATQNSNSIANNQTYLNRDFNAIRDDLMNLLKIYYPDQYQDFNAVSIGMSLVDLMAYVGDLLSYHTDKRFNEMFLETAQETTSLYRIAKNLGYKAPGFRPAITVVDFSIEVPPTVSGPDINYLPLYRPGVQIKGAGQVFETANEVDFSSDFSDDGVANRKIEPIFNSNQDILRYRVTKRELAKAGQTKIFSLDISVQDSQTQFFEVTLPDTNVLEILSIIAKPGNGFAGDPSFSDFNDFKLKFWEVDELPQNTVFVADTSTMPVNGISVGQYLEVDQRFIKEFMADGSCKITFGGGNAFNNSYQSYLQSIPINQTGQIQIKHMLDNTSLGVTLPGNSTLYVKYRVGGGNLSNVGSNALQQVANISAVILGSNPQLNQQVIGSTTATNVVPALGGADLPTADELRFSISGNFAAQRRCVTLQDYITRAYQLPGSFGAPFKIHGETRDNKVVLYILSQDANGKLMTTSLSIVKNNLITFMEPFRMINDFVEINDGKVIDLSIEIDLFTDKVFNGNEIKLNAINAVAAFFDINKWNMNQNIYVSQVVDVLKNIAGVINVVDVRFYNMDGGNYSNTIIAQANGQRELVQAPSTFRTVINYLDNAIYSTPISMFEVRFPEVDIKCRIA